MKQSKHKGSLRGKEAQERTIKKEINLWDNNEVQFARMLCKVNAIRDKDMTIDLARSMNLEGEEVDDIFRRAEESFHQARDRAYTKILKDAIGERKTK